MEPRRDTDPQDARPRGRRAVSGPLLWAAVSTAISAVGLGGYLWLCSDPDRAAAAARAELLRKATSTPERAAESYLAASTGCDLQLAAELSRGQARLALRPDAGAQPRNWDCLPGARGSQSGQVPEAWRLLVQESHKLAEGEIALKGTAQGQKTGHPCNCTVELVTARHGERWYVTEIHVSR